jgi:hypothetical protein
MLLHVIDAALFDGRPLSGLRTLVKHVAVLASMLAKVRLPAVASQLYHHYCHEQAHEGGVCGHLESLASGDSDVPYEWVDQVAVVLFLAACILAHPNADGRRYGIAIARLTDGSPVAAEKHPLMHQVAY